MKIKELRQKNNISQTELAKKLGVSQKSISNYEKGLTDPDIKTLMKLAECFHTTVDNLIGNETPYLLDKSQFTPAQLEIIDKIKALSEDTCQKIDAYIEGVKVAEEEKQRLINFYNRGQK